jgi:hypothetical protein
MVRDLAGKRNMSCCRSGRDFSDVGLVGAFCEVVDDQATEKGCEVQRPTEGIVR